MIATSNVQSVPSNGIPQSGFQNTHLIASSDEYAQNFHERCGPVAGPGRIYCAPL